MIAVAPSFNRIALSLALERGVNNVGPMAPSATTALKAMGIQAADAVSRIPAQVTTDDLEGADRRGKHRKCAGGLVHNANDTAGFCPADHSFVLSSSRTVNKVGCRVGFAIN